MIRAFTMIELIFVIVILGILATVAIPRLTATRDDAEIAKASTNLNTLIGDLGAYYTSQGEFANKLSNMTNIQFAGDGSSDQGTLSDEMLAAGKKCIKLSLNTTVGNDDKPAFLKIEGGTDKDQAICKKILESKNIDKIMKNKFIYKKKSVAQNGTITYSDAESGAGEIAVSGIGIRF